MNRRIAVLLIVLLVVVPLSARKQKPIQHAPLPAKVLAAKTIFIQNNSGRADIADNAYTLLKNWGRYQIVDAKEKADLVLVLAIATEQKEGSSAHSVNMHNSQTGAWTYGTVSAPSTDTWHYTVMTLVDPKTGDTTWTDRRIWWRKHYPSEELINSLRERIEEQEKSASK